MPGTPHPRPLGPAAASVPTARPFLRTLTLGMALLLAALGDGASGAAWEVKADPPAEPFKLSVKPGQSIPLPDHTGMWPLYPQSASPFVSVGENNDESCVREVWDLRTFQRTGAIRGKVVAVRGLISPDGRYYAAVSADNDKERSFEVWSFVDGKRACRIEPKPLPKKILAWAFTAKGRLVVALELQKSKVLQAYDAATGALVRSHDLPNDFHDGTLAPSPGGRYVSYVAGKEVRVVEVETGKVAGTVTHPSIIGIGAAFSHDGSELAVLFMQSPGARLMVWDLEKGEAVVDYPLPTGPDFPTPGWADNGEPAIDWLPDGSAWMIRGHALINRKDGRWVWSLFGPSSKDPKTGHFLPNAFIYNQSVRLLDDDHVLGAVRSAAGGARLEVTAIPWPLIDATLKAIDTNTPALMRPGGSISLKFYFGPLRFATAQEAEAGLTEAISEALAGEGITVAANQPVTLHIRHSEEPGPPYRIVGPGLSATGSSVTSTKFTTELALTVNNGRVPVWSTQKTATGLGMFTTDRNTGGRADEPGMRMGGFAGVKEWLKHLSLPVFIPRPQDKTLAMLPGTTVVTPSPLSRSSVNRAAGAKSVKPTNRGKAAGAAKKP